MLVYHIADSSQLNLEYPHFFLTAFRPYEFRNSKLNHHCSRQDLTAHTDALCCREAPGTVLLITRDGT